jgi:hypothetical protein
LIFRSGVIFFCAGFAKIIFINHYFQWEIVWPLENMRFLSAFLFGNALTNVNAADRFLPPWKFDGTVWPQPQSMVVKEDYQILGTVNF